MKHYTLYILYIITILFCNSCKDGNSFGDDFVPSLYVVDSGQDNSEQENNLCPDDNHPHMIDLGLSVKWSCCNVGASKPEDYGDYFAWGETEGHKNNKTTFNWSTYKYCEGTEDSMTKYCILEGYGTIDNKWELELNDDAAYVNWGNQWRMPAYDDVVELKTKCTWTATTQSGIYGYEVTGSNDNRIFLPAAGAYVNYALGGGPGTYGYYWTRTLYTEYSNQAFAIYIHSGAGAHTHRYYGFSVRPVQNK